MYEKKKILEIGDIRIATAAFLCFTLFEVFPGLKEIAVIAAALATIIFCCGADLQKSFAAACMRMKTILIGFFIGAASIWADEFMQNRISFMFLAALGILAVLAVCWLTKLPYIQAKISCVIYVLVIAVMQGPFRITYGLMFLLGSVIGGVVSVFVAFLFDVLVKKFF